MSHDEDRALVTTLNQSTSADSFDVDSLRLSHDFAADLGVKKLLNAVPRTQPKEIEGRRTGKVLTDPQD